MHFINSTKKVRKGKGWEEVPIKMVCINESTRMFVECNPDITQEEFDLLKKNYGF